MEFKKQIFLILFCGIILNSCTPSKDTESEGSGQQQVNVNGIFSNQVTEFEVKVYYEVGAEPYVGNLGVTSNQTWDITKSSYVALFQNHTGRTVTVPTTLSQMNGFSDKGKSTWSARELLSLGNQMAPLNTNNQKATVTVIFLNGTYEGNSNILGIHFSGYLFAFVFKDIVVSAGGADPTGQKYVEQATVVHEIGHIVGLVNNGVPMVGDHEDKNHSHHSTNSNCVMYWAVESSQNILSSLTNFIIGNQLNLFGTEVLQDGRAYHP